MQPHSELSRKWRRFNRKHGLNIFIALCVIAVVAFVAVLMYLLTNPSWQGRP